MKSKIIITVFLLAFYSSVAYPQNSEKQLDTDTINVIYESVYEVVLKKPFDNPYTIEKKEKENRSDEIRNDPIIYEEELPWDILPYTARMDEYYSIGTAFAISENEYLSAAHVLSLDKELTWDDIYIRDKNGNVIEIDQITKFSNYKDFVVFTTKKNTSSTFLKINPKYDLNTKVFAVGNAFGEGIVIRDGLLTSTTKETESGEWDWIRFSAAASPGNSGGPLLNSKGEIIGIVLRKSQDENLNYALPISEVLNSKEKTGFHHKFLNYNLIITSKKYGPEKLDKEIALPMNYKEFRNENITINRDFSVYMINKLLEKYDNSIFPNGSGAYRVLHLTSSIYYPHVVIENQDDGIWDIYRPKEIKQSQLDNNGYLKYGALSNMGTFELKIPDSVSLEETMTDSKKFIELFLKGYPINRTFGSQQIRIVSLGSAIESEEFIDKYNRKWLVEKWPLEFANSKLLIISLPTPSGRIGYFYLNDVNSINNDLILDIKEYTNFLYYSYNGTFKQWDNYLKLKDYLPEIFKSCYFFYDNKSVTFTSSRFNISYSPELFKIDDESYLALKTAYFRDNENVIWDLSGISIWENKNDKNYLSLVRETKPESSLPEDYQNDWNDLVYRKFPYNGEVQIDSSNTFVTDIYKNYATLDIDSRKSLDMIYSIGLSMEGNIEKEKLLKKFEMINSSISILDDNPIPSNIIKTKEGKLRH